MNSLMCVSCIDIWFRAVELFTIFSICWYVHALYISVSYFSADAQAKMHDEYINVEYSGMVRWVPPAIYKSSCQIDMRDFPFDEQTCMFKFGSWAYNGNKLTLAFNEGLVDLDMREFVQSSEWDVMHTSAEKHVRIYPCCPNEPYPDLTFYLTLKRRTAFYFYVLILPSVLLSSLTLVLFWIPPQRPDRTSLGEYNVCYPYELRSIVIYILLLYNNRFDIVNVITDHCYKMYINVISRVHVLSQM